MLNMRERLHLARSGSRRRRALGANRPGPPLAARQPKTASPANPEQPRRPPPPRAHRLVRTPPQAHQPDRSLDYFYRSETKTRPSNKLHAPPNRGARAEDLQNISQGRRPPRAHSHRTGLRRTGPVRRGGIAWLSGRATERRRSRHLASRSPKRATHQRSRRLRRSVRQASTPYPPSRASRPSPARRSYHAALLRHDRMTQQHR